MKKYVLFILIIGLLFVSLTYAGNQVTVRLDGELIEFDVQPLIVDGRTLVPLRAIFEAFDMSVEWDEDLRK